MFKTRKEFLKEFAHRAGLRSLSEADRVAQVLIGLIKVRIGPKLSEMISKSVPEDLSKGWDNIALPSEAMELQEIMFELEEVGEENKEAADTRAPEYG